MISSKADTTFVATFPAIKTVNRVIQDLFFTNRGICDGSLHTTLYQL